LDRCDKKFGRYGWYFEEACFWINLLREEFWDDLAAFLDDFPIDEDTPAPLLNITVHLSAPEYADLECRLSVRIFIPILTAFKMEKKSTRRWKITNANFVKSGILVSSWESTRKKLFSAARRRGETLI
jgi:hypothetical protein